MIANTQAIHQLYRPTTPGDGATVTRHLPSLPQAMRAIASGNWAVVEHKLPPLYGGQRPYAHAQVDLIFYVLEGQPTFQLGEQTLKTEAGSWIVVNRGTVHTYFNSQREPARFLAFCLPGDVGEALCDPAEMVSVEAVQAQTRQRQSKC